MAWHPDPITGEPVMHLGKGYGDIYASQLDDADDWYDDEWDEAEDDDPRGNGTQERPVSTGDPLLDAIRRRRLRLEAADNGHAIAPPEADQNGRSLPSDTTAGQDGDDEP